MKLVLPKKNMDLLRTIKWELQLAIEKSRFRLRDDNYEFVSDRTLKFSGVRLKENKPYCGNHPNACEFNVGGKHKRLNYLEGADWVEFNDLVNDVLDRLGVDAKVSSAVCILRKGCERRIAYGSTLVGRFRPFWQWEKFGQPEDYEDYIGKVAPASEFPMGTPGNYERISYAQAG